MTLRQFYGIINFMFFPNFSNSAAADLISLGKTGESTHGDEWHIPHHQVVFRNIVGKTCTLRPDARSGVTSFYVFQNNQMRDLGAGMRDVIFIWDLLFYNSAVTAMILIGWSSNWNKFGRK